MDKITLADIKSIEEDIDHIVAKLQHATDINPVTAFELRMERDLLHKCFRWLNVSTTPEFASVLQRISDKFQVLSDLITEKVDFLPTS